MALRNFFVLTCLIFVLFLKGVYPQTEKAFHVSRQYGEFNLDGILNEQFWQTADSINGLTMAEPAEYSRESEKTVVKIAADSAGIYIGVICYDDAEKITAYSKARDKSLRSEDNIKFILDTYRDERTGYVFAVNPFGARYDALIAEGGNEENSDWDGIWDASAKIQTFGWSAEIVIPIKSIRFKKGLREWGFNIERRIQRLLERDRWSAPARNFKVTTIGEAGILKNLPDFDIGLGLLVKISPNAGFHKNYSENTIFEKDISADITQRITPNISAALTINTDFAETEVDSRRTNLTRFPLFYPEKRRFFLIGADIFDFGLGLGSNVIPFHSRKIGLYKGQEVPIIFGSKINGKAGNTNFGAIFVRTDKVDNLVPPENLGVIRVKQNILEQSNFGIIATAGDPSGKTRNWLIGADFTYQTSSFLHDKIFLAGIWGLYSNRPDLTGYKSSFGFKLDYPNDLFDIALKYFFIGDSFNPALGFVPRNGIKYYSLGFDYMPRPKWKLIRQFFFESSGRLITGLDNRWQSYGYFTAPFHFLLESGDRFEFNIYPQGERLTEKFEISDGIVLSPGEYNYLRYRMELETASKRPLSGQATWWFGTFYTGTLDVIELEMNLRLTDNFIFQMNYEKNIAELKEGDFQQDLLGARLEWNFSSNLQLSSFIQYDNESNSIGTNTRLHWTITPLTDFYLVYNHNVDKIITERWRFNSNQLILKLNYGLWY